MSEQNEVDKLPEYLVAFKLVQHHVMQGESTFDDFQTRVQALKLLAQKLDQLKMMEEELAERERYIKQLEFELEAEKKLSPVGEEVMKDLDSIQ